MIQGRGKRDAVSGDVERSSFTSFDCELNHPNARRFQSKVEIESRSQANKRKDYENNTRTVDVVTNGYAGARVVSFVEPFLS